MKHFTPDIRVDLPREKDIAVSVTRFGARAQAGFCNTLPFRDAIDFCKRAGGGVLDIPRGVYHFYHAPGRMFTSRWTASRM